MSDAFEDAIQRYVAELEGPEGVEYSDIEEVT